MILLGLILLCGGGYFAIKSEGVLALLCYVAAIVGGVLTAIGLS